jgi:hypothetical protein
LSFIKDKNFSRMRDITWQMVSQYYIMCNMLTEESINGTI